CAARARNDPEGRLGLAELRCLGGDDQVARHRELAAAAETEAGHRGDEGRPERANCVPPLDPALVVEVDCREARELADVGACSKCPLAAAEDDAADRLVA